MARLNTMSGAYCNKISLYDIYTHSMLAVQVFTFSQYNFIAKCQYTVIGHASCSEPKLFLRVVLSHQHYSAVRPGSSIRVCPEANVKGTLLRNSCAWRRLNEHPHYNKCDPFSRNES